MKISRLIIQILTKVTGTLFLLLISISGLNGQAFSVQWERSYDDGSLPAWFGSNAERSMVYHDGKLYIASRGNGDYIRIIDASDGSDIGSIDASSVSGGVFFNTVAVSDDGYIFASNLTVDASNEAFRVYAWENDGTYLGEVETRSTDTDLRIGDYITVVGSVSDGTAVMYAPISQTEGRLLRWGIKLDGNGDMDFFHAGSGNDHMYLPGWDGDDWFRPPSIAPIAPDTSMGFFATGRGSDIARSYNADNTSTGYLHIPDESNKGDNVAISYHLNKYMFSLKALSNVNHRVSLSTVLPSGDSNTNRTGSSIATFGPIGPSTNGIRTGAITAAYNGEGTFTVYVLITNNGIWALEITVPTTEITTWAQLDNIRNNRDGHYVIKYHLHKNTAGYNGTGNNWNPIGTSSSNPFTGILEGTGKENPIEGLVLSGAVWGFFGHTKDAYISDVHLIGVDMTTDRNFSGALIGWSWNTIVSGSYASGELSSTGNYCAGGLLGRAEKVYITDSGSSVTVTHNWSGGTGVFAAGLIGALVDGGVLIRSFASGDVVGEDVVGGLMGLLRAATVIDSYSRGDVAGDDRVGGLIGRINESLTIRSFSTGTPSGTSNVGGLIGINDPNGVVTDSFWDTETSGRGNSAGGTGKTTDEMKTEVTFTNAGWDFDNRWMIYENLSYPFFQSELMEIGSWQELDYYPRRWVDGKYLLTGDLDAESPGYNTYNGNDWTKIGSWTPDDEDAFSFRGIFNGDGYTISDIFIDSDHGHSTGFFGAAKNALIADLKVTNADVTTTGSAAGVLVGRINNTDIFNCFSSGNIDSEGTFNIGGLVGRAEGTSAISRSGAAVNITFTGNRNAGGLVGRLLSDAKISSSFATGRVAGPDRVGGLVGSLEGTVLNSYARGNLSGDDRVGGLAGWNDGTVTNSYSIGYVSGNTNTGGLIGEEGAGGSTTNSFWDVEVSGQSDSAGGTSTTHTEMKTRSTFTDVGWDFSTASSSGWLPPGPSDTPPVWNILEGYSYPYLQWETDTKPIKVTSWTELDDVRNNLGGYYILMNDLDEESDGYDDTGDDWTPISTFRGLFDGNEYTISGLEINGASRMALFGYARDASILNTGLLNITISATDRNVGAFIGEAIDHVVVFNCYSTGNITCTGEFNVGGLLGRITGTFVSNSWSSVTIVHTAGAANANSAGLVGFAAARSKIFSSFATGNINGTNRVGGLVGRLGAGNVVIDSYARGNVTGNDGVGGLVARNEGFISKSYSTGYVNGSSNEGGLTGLHEGTVEDSFWDTQTSGQTGTPGGTGRSTTQMRTQSNFEGAGWDFTDTWGIYDELSYPYLQWETREIEDWNGLNNIRNTMALRYILMNDLDEESDGYDDTGDDWTPIGTYDAVPFTGIFDGNEYTISGLILNHDDVDAGLFGYAEGASFLNLGLQNVDITTSDERAGALVGRSDNIVVSNCYSTGNIVSTGRVNIAGLIGYTTGPSFITKSWSSVDIDHNWSGGTGVNTGGLIGAMEEDGILSMSFATGNISGEDGVGGLVGRHSGSIVNSYARGNVTGTDDRTGGLVGRNNNGSITNSYSTGRVSGGGSLGGLVGNSVGGSAANSFWDTETSGQGSSAGGTGQTRANMRKAATFTSAPANWDFGDIWDIHEDNSYPFLRENNPTPDLDWLGVTTGTPQRPHWFSYSTERGMAIVEEGEDDILLLVPSAYVFSENVVVHIIDTQTGKDAGFMDLSGITSGGTFYLSDIAVSEDNRIFISNYTGVVHGDNYGHFRVWMFENTEDDTPELVIDDTRPDGDDDFRLARFISMTGSYTAGTATLYAVSDRHEGPAERYMIRYKQTGPGEIFDVASADIEEVTASVNPLASAFRPGSAPFYTNSFNEPIRRYDGAVQPDGQIATNVISSNAVRIQFIGTCHDGHDYIAVINYPNNEVMIVKVPNGDPTAVTESHILGTTPVLNEFSATSTAGNFRAIYNDGGFDVYVMFANNGIAKYRIDHEIQTLRAQEDLLVGGTDRGWRMFSMPVGGVTIKGLSDQYFVQGFGPDLYPRFGPNILFVDAEANAWSAKGRDQNYEFPAGEGFIWFFYNGETGGYPNDHPLPVWLSVDGLTPGDDIEAYSLAQGSNLIGNPFNLDLDLNGINTWVDESLGSVLVQVWDNTGGDHQVDPENGGYSHSGTWRVIGETGQHGHKIAPWQGFVIDNLGQDPATQITIPKSAAPRFRGRERGFYKSEEKPSWHRLSFSLVNIQANGNRMVTDEAASLLFHPKASEGWDIYDAGKMTPISDRFATLSFLGERNGEAILKAQESRPLDFEGQIEIPVSFESYELDGSFEIKWDGLDELPEEWYLMLADHEAGTLTDLRLEESLVFSIEEPLRRSSARDGETQKGFASGGAPAQLSAEEFAGSEVLPFMESLSLPVHFSGLRKYGTQGSATRFTLIVSTEPISGEILADLPEKVELLQNYPNPFNPVTVLPYALPEESHVRLSIYDILGRQVAVLVDGVMQAGRYEVSWDATRQASGVYIYRLEAGGEAFTRKMTLVK